MTEADARDWILARYGAEAHDRVERFLARVVAENFIQNLISPATVPTIWVRHALDSAQLLSFAPVEWKRWIDIGTGGGFPGMIVALLVPDRKVVMVEPRRKRAAFLHGCIGGYGLAQARVDAVKIEAVRDVADVISARAVASPENLLRLARHCATSATTWLLPRGRSGDSDAIFSRLSQTMFHVEHSLTDPESVIAVLTGTGQ